MSMKRRHRLYAEEGQEADEQACSIVMAEGADPTNVCTLSALSYAFGVDESQTKPAEHAYSGGLIPLPVLGCTRHLTEQDFEADLTLHVVDTTLERRDGFW